MVLIIFGINQVQKVNQYRLDTLLGKGSFSSAFVLHLGKHTVLDEVGDLDMDTQAKLLGALEAGRFFRVGGSTPLEPRDDDLDEREEDLKVMGPLQVHML